MMDKPAYITPEGLKKLKAELDELINVRRVELAKRLHAAIKQGDLSENADYQTAKEEQQSLESCQDSQCYRHAAEKESIFEKIVERHHHQGQEQAIGQR